MLPVTMRQADSGDTTRCPIASRGLDDPLLWACPGFQPEPVDFIAMGHGRAIAGTSCAHLAAQRSARGYHPGCAHRRATAMVRAAGLVDSLPHIGWQSLREAACSVIVTDVAGIITHWNPRAEALFGWTELEAVGRSVLDTTVGAEEVAAATEVMTAVLGGYAWEGMFSAALRDGGRLPIRVLDVPMFARGQLAGVAGLSVAATDTGTDLRALAAAAGLLATTAEAVTA